MKKSNKGFTLVELIIVIAVIGVLAAILIPTFSNVIDKANRKSAFSDAKNALSILLAEETTGDGAVVVKENTIFEVKKANKYYQFRYEDNGLKDVTPEKPTDDKSHGTGSAVSQVTFDNCPTTVEVYEPVGE